MKVLQINSVCGVGSTGRIATDIHNLLKKQDHESYIAYGRNYPMNCETTIRIGNKYDNFSHVALTRITDKHGFGSKNATLEFIKKIEELDPQIIHLHNIHGYYINIELLFEYLKKTNKPIVWTFHDCWAFTGHCTYFDYSGCEKWKKGCNKCPQKKEYPTSLLFDNSEINYLRKKELFTGIKNLTIITPSKWLANLVKTSFLGNFPIEVINNGVNLDVFKPTKSNFRKINNLDNKFVILGVASIWSERKGFDYFVKLSSQLDENDVILLVGLTEQQKKELPDNIIGINSTNNIIELAEIYSTADVFVNPTLEDNFPTTNLEALACGTPVITFNTGGSIESIDEKCGIIVEKGSSSGLKKSIQKFKKKRFLETDCLKRSKLYDKNANFGKYIDVYLNMIK